MSTLNSQPMSSPYAFWLGRLSTFPSVPHDQTTQNGESETHYKNESWCYNIDFLIFGYNMFLI